MIKKPFKGLVKVNFQEEIGQKMARQALINRDLFLKDGICREMTLSAPTGSGKTVMEYKTTQGILNEDPLGVFFHMTIGKGDLHFQAAKKFKMYSQGTIKCYTTRDIPYLRDVKPHDHFFLNWESLNKVDKKTGEVISLLAQEHHESLMTFPMLCSLLKEKGYNPYLVIDEDHEAAQTIKSQAIISQLCPVVRICQSATSKASPSTEADRFEVPREKVIEAQLISLGFIMQHGLKPGEKVTRERLIELAFECKKELVDLAQKEGVRYNPLVAIQIANGDLGIDQKKAVVSFLRTLGITEENGKLAFFLSEDKSDAIEGIEDENSQVQVLIFKQAVATGWDCPRAKIWLKLRDIKSTTFNTQTGGRFLRTVNQCYFKSEALNWAYMFTDEENYDYDESVYKPAQSYDKGLKITLDPEKAEDWKEYSLVSEYSSREGNYGDFQSDIQQKVFDPWIKKNKLIEGDIEGNQNKLKEKGYLFNKEVTRNVLGKGQVSVENFLDKDKANFENESHKYHMSEEEVTLKLKGQARADLVGDFSFERSWGRVSPAIKKIALFLFKEEAIYRTHQFLSNPSNWKKFTDDLKPDLDNYKKELESKKKKNHDEKRTLALAPERTYNSKNNSVEKVVKGAYVFIDDSSKKVSCVIKNSQDPDTEVVHFYKEWNSIAGSLSPNIRLHRNGKNTEDDLRIIFEDPTSKKRLGYHPDLLMPEKLDQGFQTGIFDIKHFKDIQSLTVDSVIVAKHNAQIEYMKKHSTPNHRLYGGLLVQMQGSGGLVSFKVFEGELDLKALNKGDFSSGIDFETYMMSQSEHSRKKVA